MFQTHISEGHGYDAQLFASSEALPEADFRGIVSRHQEPTFMRQAVTYVRLLSIVQENSSRFAPTYGVHRPPEQVHARVEDGPSSDPPYVETTYYHTYGDTVRMGTAPQ